MDLISRQNQFIKEGQDCLSRIQEDLAAVASLHQSKKLTGEAAEIDSLRTLQLVLQYRLDNQSALQRLFLIHQNLWQVLGVSPQQSNAINMERLDFALGTDDLHHALSILSQLIDALLRVIHRYSDKKKEMGTALNRKQLVMRKPKNTQSIQFKKMVKVVEAQKSFNFILDQLGNTLENVVIEGDSIYGPIYDHIGQLNGPIYLFYTALRLGLAVSTGLYKQLQVNCNLNKKLNELLLEANNALAQSHQLVDRPQLFRPSKQISSSQELDARAAEKRLGCFFYHP